MPDGQTNLLLPPTLISCTASVQHLMTWFKGNGRFAALDGAIKDGAIDQSAMIVHLDRIRGFRGRSLPSLMVVMMAPDSVLCAPGSAAALVRERRAGFLFDIGHRIGRHLLHLLNLRPVHVEVDLCDRFKTPSVRWT